MLDTTYMQLAVSLAREMQGQTGTNPSVGAVVVRHGRIVGMGAHLRQGQAHAEVHALHMAGSEAQGATLYVTLEPCHHTGLTPPCTQAIVQAGIAKVVVGTLDPDPRCQGRGIAFLRERGIPVVVGVLMAEAQQLIESFVYSVRTKRPYVTLKTAMSLDGMIATATGESQWLTQEATRSYSRQLRHRHEAIAVGIGTALADDPQLTVRMPEGRDPIRCVFDSRLRLPVVARMLERRQDSLPSALVFTTQNASVEAERQLVSRGAEVIRTDGIDRVNVHQALHVLYERRIGSLLIEGGGVLGGALLQERLVCRIVAFIAPRLLGHGAKPAFDLPSVRTLHEAIAFERVTLEQIGDDVCWSGSIRMEAEE